MGDETRVAVKTKVRISDDERVRLWVDVFKAVVVAAVPATTDLGEAIAYGEAAANKALGEIEMHAERGAR